MTISASVHERQSKAAKKAWITMRMNKIEQVKAENESIEEYLFHKDMRTVLQGTYKINPPLIKPSKLTWIEKGGVGKELSDGWAINYAIGCTHACRFCYVDQIHKKYGYTEAKAKIPEILEQFIKAGKESISKANLR